MKMSRMNMKMNEKRININYPYLFFKKFSNYYIYFNFLNSNNFIFISNIFYNY